MEKLQVIIDNIEEPKGDYPVWGRIYIKCEETTFPSEVWYDAASSILTMWLQNAGKLILQASNYECFCFMDGDYSIRVSSIDGVSACADFITPSGQTYSINDIDLRYFCRQLLSAAAKVEQNSPTAPVLEELVYEAQKAREALRRTRG